MWSVWELPALLQWMSGWFSAMVVEAGSPIIEDRGPSKASKVKVENTSEVSIHVTNFDEARQNGKKMLLFRHEGLWLY